jgi:hypothetical protein
MLGGEVRFCRWSVPRGLVFLTASAICRGIFFPSFFRSPMEIYSDVNGEAGETCSEVEGQRIVVFFR